MLFKRKKNKQRPSPDWLLRLAARERKCRYRLNVWLQHLTEEIPETRLRLYCLSIGMVFIGIFTCCILQAIHDPANLSPPGAISMPAVRYKQKKHMIDSLRGQLYSRQLFDSLKRYRPGLLDTILNFEKYNR